MTRKSTPWDGLHHGRIPSKRDDRDDNFQLRLLNQRSSIVDKPGNSPKKRTLALPWVGNQGRSPFCVGFTGEAVLRTRPGVQYLSKLSGPAIYQGAQMYDEIPGEGYEGTTTRGLMAFLVDYHPAKDIQSYWWVRELEEALVWVGGLTPGPIAWGTNWYTGMYEPSKEGIVKVSGVVGGGHEYLMIGYDDKRELALFQNSWGPEWGLKGRFWVPYQDAQRLLQEDGEAAAAAKYERYQRPTTVATRPAQSGKL